MNPGRVRFHLPARMIGQPLPPFYRKLIAGMVARGAQVDILARDLAALANPQGQDFDFVHNGGVARPRALNLGTAYLADFYYCDPKGLYFESSLNDRPFHPDKIDPNAAARFMARLRSDYVIQRRSRYAQAPQTVDFGQGHIAVFLQDWSEPIERSRHMDGFEMIRAVLAARAGRQVIVKPHPRNKGLETFEIQAFLAKKHPEVLFSEANVHDILAGAAVSVSISSSVAVEGFLHGVPAILFGKSDLHPCAVTVQHAKEWPDALRRALAQDWPFDRFLLWFLQRHCIDTKRKFLDNVIGRMARNGADLAALGLNSADHPPKD